MVIFTLFYFISLLGFQRRTAVCRVPSPALLAGSAESAGRQQQREQREQRARPRGPRRPGRAVAAAARVPLALELLAQDARVGRRALAPHVVDARPPVLAVQELVVTHVGCKTAGEGGERVENKSKVRPQQKGTKTRIEAPPPSSS